MAVFGLQKEDMNDEIKCFQTARYVSTNEAVWRILAFPIHSHHPPIQHLRIHLENKQSILHPRKCRRKSLRSAENNPNRIFVLCTKDLFARILLYNDVPKYYTWTEKKWKPRGKAEDPLDDDNRNEGSTIGRVYTVHPNNTETYHLRLLLHVVPGPTSLQDLRTFDGTLYDTCQEVCKQRGLLENDNYWKLALTEAPFATVHQNTRPFRNNTPFV
eukprot:m.42686 g.42686  ORF g.42686 m.42686 type:complete len:215 (+) comp33376_c0_seq1:836-1480(+)